MKVDYEGEQLDFDLEQITVRQAMLLQQHLGLTLLSLDDGLVQGDPKALLAIYWLMRTNASDKPVDIDSLDFKIVKLANAIQEAVEKDDAAKAEAEQASPKGERKGETTTP